MHPGSAAPGPQAAAASTLAGAAGHGSSSAAMGVFDAAIPAGVGGLQFQPHSAESNGVNTPTNSNGSNSGEGPDIKRESGLSGQLPLPMPRGLVHASSTGQVPASQAGPPFQLHVYAHSTSKAVAQPEQ